MSVANSSSTPPQIQEARSRAIERLRKSKEQLVLQGKELGAEWVLGDDDRNVGAEIREIERLISYHNKQSNWDVEIADDSDDVAYTPSEQVYFAIHPECDGDRDESSEWWGFAIGESNMTIRDNVAFLTGFVEGALETYRDLKAEL